VLIAALEKLQNSGNRVGEIELSHLMAKNHFIVIKKKSKPNFSYGKNISKDIQLT
jgi:hypothetical protein